jgi:hypothetical protein
MTAIEFIQRCTLNFTFDAERLVLETPIRSELTLSGCGWDEGHEWYSVFPATALLEEVERCLRGNIATSHIAIAGTELDYPIELDGGCGGRSSDTATESPVAAKIEIVIARKRITLQVVTPLFTG